MTSPAADRLARARAFEERLREAAADRLLETRYGTAVVTPSLPRIWDQNVLRLREGARVGAQALAGEAERVLGPAGVAHRRVSMGPETGERLRPAFESLGWRVDRYVFMAAERPVAPGRAGERVVELTFEDVWAFRRQQAEEERGAGDVQLLQQLGELYRRWARAGRPRHFGVVADGKVVSVSDLYSDGRTAQIEDVATLPAYRNRGYATTTVLSALAAATCEGHELVFLVADADDWPKELYSGLGFEEIGLGYAFLRVG